MTARRVGTRDDAPRGQGTRKDSSTHVTWSAPGVPPVKGKGRSSGSAAGSGRGLSSERSSRTETATADTKPAAKPQRGLSSERSSRIDTTPASRSDNVEMVVTGLLACVYLLTTVAWLIVALRSPITFADALSNVMFMLGLWVAVAAGPLWFVGIMLFGREFSFARRAILYVLGVVVLVPWPYISWAAG